MVVQPWWGVVSWWQRLLEAFHEEPVALMVREGRELRWNRERMPLALYVDASAAAWWLPLTAAVAAANVSAGRKLLLYPEEPLREIRDAFTAGGADGVPGAVYVTGDGAALATHGDTDVRFDQRAGLIRNALVRLPAAPPAWAPAMALHELGHALGLDHDHGPGSVMGARLSGRESPRFSPATVDLLRRVYG